MIKLTRRTIAIAIAAVTLGTGSAVAAGTAATAAPDKPAAISRCFGSNLAVWVNADTRNVINGANRYHLNFTNTGRQACTLNGFPGITAVTAGGKRLGAPAAHSGGVPAATITIKPGATVHAVFGYVFSQVIPSCKPGFATQLKVFGPGVALGKHAFFPAPACTTGRVYMYTWRVQAGL